MIWTDFYVDLTNHGLRRSALSNPVDPIQPQKWLERRLQYNTANREEVSEVAEGLDCAGAVGFGQVFKDLAAIPPQLRFVVLIRCP